MVFAFFSLFCGFADDLFLFFIILQFSAAPTNVFEIWRVILFIESAFTKSLRFNISIYINQWKQLGYCREIEIKIVASLSDLKCSNWL